MSEDALWLLDLFRMQLESLKFELTDRRTICERFDKFSYGAWAVEESINAIYNYRDCQYVQARTILEILETQLQFYSEYSSTTKDKNRRFEYACDMVEQLIKLTGGVINE